MKRPIRVATAAAVLVTAAACDISGPDVGPPARVEGATAEGSLVVGQTLEMTLTVLDAQGREVEGEDVTWTPSGAGTVDPATSRTDADGLASTLWTLDTAPGTQTLTAAAGDVRTTYSVQIATGPLAAVVMAPAADTLTSLGDTLQVTAQGQDQYGNEVATPDLTWASSAPTVASVAAGEVIAHLEGAADITATSGSVTGTVAITVDQAVDEIGMDPTAPVLVVGETVDVNATPVDARGFAVDTSLDLTWASSNTAVATVNDSGVVTAVATGTSFVTATAASWSGAAEVTVSDGARPTISAITPSTLGAGDTATIAGTGFGTNAGVVDVTVGGIATPLITLTDTLLTVRMPAVGSFPCAPAGDRDVVVTVDGLDVTAAHPVAGAVRHTLATGESVALLDNAVACNEIAEPGTYVLSVFNADTDPEATTAFRLQGTGSGASLRLARSRIQVPVTRPADRMDPEIEDHLRMLERNRRLVEQLGTPGIRPSSPPIAAEAVGDLRTFRIPQLDSASICPNYVEVDARAKYVGTYGVVWEDTLAPLAGTMDAVWDTVGTEYDNVMHQILLDYFGDPLAFDDRLDANGLFFMLYSEVVNDFQSTAVNGFVFSGDFYSRSLCPSSDGGEIFYGRVPTVEDTDGDPYDSGEIGYWKWSSLATVIHEVKHLTMYANKFDVNASNPNLEDRGLEEATARLAEEFYGRAIWGHGQDDNVTYQESIFCGRRPRGNDGCPGDQPRVMGKHYSGVNTYLKSPALLSPFGRANPEDNSFYGSGWQWVRWAIDQSALAEADIIKPLIRESALTGPENLADKVGSRTVAELLADYTLAFAVDDHPSGTVPARAALTLPSWDTRDIFQGLHDDYSSGGVPSGTYPTPWPLATTSLTGGSFQVDVAEIHGGGASFFELSGMSGAQLLELLDDVGGTAPASLGLSIVRIQ